MNVNDHSDFTVQNDPEMLMAEVHFILTTKQQHQGELDPNEKYWLEKSTPYYEKHEAVLPKDAITMEIMTARLQGREYVSRTINEPINHGMLMLAYRKLNAKTESAKGFLHRVFDEIKEMACR